MRITAHLGYMWQDVPLLDRVHIAADAGFDGVEIPTPYDLPAREVQRALMAAGIPLVTVATPPPNYTGGGQGFLARTGGESRFQHDFKRALRYASALNIPLLHLLTGPLEAGPPHQARDTMRRNLEWAVNEARDMTLLLGASMNSAVQDPAQAVELVEITDSANLRLLLDVDDADAALPIIKANGSSIGCISVYSGHNRACPGADDAALTTVSDVLDGIGYKGGISAAYTFSAKDKDPLRWRAALKFHGSKAGT